MINCLFSINLLLFVFSIFNLLFIFKQVIAVLFLVVLIDCLCLLFLCSGYRGSRFNNINWLFIFIQVIAVLVVVLLVDCLFLMSLSLFWF